jgi:predicted phosphoribosyltransferase
MGALFRDRCDAGRRLAERLADVIGATEPSRLAVLALPRGGVPVALEVAKALGAPLDLLLVRKIGAPHQPELAVAAIADGVPPVLVLEDTLSTPGAELRRWIDQQASIEQEENVRRRARYLDGRRPLELRDRTVIVVDDGIATGTTMRAALQSLQTRGARRVLLAVPVAPADALAQLAPLTDHVVCLACPEPFIAVGLHYDDFTQVDDRQVRDALRAVRPPDSVCPPCEPAPCEHVPSEH